jgi:toxin-antitoxin system PIN domain toxin
LNGYLLDVNALVALLWPRHEFHAAAHAWFERKSRHGWSTCPISQAGFVRIVSNPAFSMDAVKPNEALDVLAASLEHRFHRFWSDSIAYAKAAEPMRERIKGHRQITDAYLLGLAIHHDGKLATLDKRIVELVPEGHKERAHIELIPYGPDTDVE